MEEKSFRVIPIIIAILVILLIGIVIYRVRSFEKPFSISERMNKSSKNSASLPLSEDIEKPSGPPFKNIFIADFGGNKIWGVSRDGNIFFEYSGRDPALPFEKQFWAAEYVTIAPDGNLIVTDAQGQRVVKIDRQTKKILWEYGRREKPGSAPGYLHAPDIAFQLKDGGILINDGNNRRVIIVDINTNQIVWQYGHTLAMSDKPGYLKGNTFAAETPLGNILITDTIQKKILIVKRETKEIIWEWQKNDLKWPQHVSITTKGNLVLEDRQTGNIFEVDKNKNIVWQFISDKKNPFYFKYPTHAFKLNNGNYLVADAGRNEIVELNPLDNSVVFRLGNGKPQKQDVFGFPTTIAIEE